ncbi:UDP-N-acetylglucosamine/UDP-N-acetylgalactosamine diphosphorylase [Nematocida sp. ERTm5]|nr:UDP-N-acetylglucosamine/UDP-N-acetylgalactosamine diphosphorylase [Nematocida sp. ERTm5]
MHLLLTSDPERAKLEEIGKNIIQEQKIAVLTLAGGSGSRLGYENPKGTFILPTKVAPHLSLFQRQAEKIFSIGATWIIMVSSETIQKTVEHLQKVVLPKYERSVFLVIQENIDALDKDTKEPLHDVDGSVIKVPNGNGSVFKTLKTKNYIELTERSATTHNESILNAIPAIEYFNIISIDNVLVRIADPAMLGYAQKYLFEVVSAGIPEVPNKKMGVFELNNEKIEVIEYTYEKQDSTPLINAEGSKLVNIANHLISKEFIQRMDPTEIPYHEAIKKIPHAKDPAPLSPNAIKRELFIFDGFKLAKSHGVIEYGDKSYEGLKNKEGEADSIQTCADALDQVA